MRTHVLVVASPPTVKCLSMLACICLPCLAASSQANLTTTIRIHRLLGLRRPGLNGPPEQCPCPVRAWLFGVPVSIVITDAADVVELTFANESDALRLSLVESGLLAQL
uniref:DUF3244 domain-containing protein n=1 Tax=Panagrellus redivivus TaxID=6233 RepID=A0A7E4V099_PANRE